MAGIMGILLAWLRLVIVVVRYDIVSDVGMVRVRLEIVDSYRGLDFLNRSDGKCFFLR